MTNTILQLCLQRTSLNIAVERGVVFSTHISITSKIVRVVVPVFLQYKISAVL